MKKGLMILIVGAVLWTLALYVNSSKEQMNSENTPSAPQLEELPRIGFKAPGFELQGLDEEVYSLKRLNGKPVVINFWASWCGPCRLEAPELVRLYDKYNDRVEIYAVNLTSSDSIEGAKGFAEEFGFSFPVLLDLDGSVGNTYQVKAIPTTYFVNHKGIIIDQVTGLVPPDQLEKKFQNLIN